MYVEVNTEAYLLASDGGHGRVGEVCAQEGEALPQRRVRAHRGRPAVAIARESIARHLATFVQAAKIRPRSGVPLVQLHRANVRLESIHRLILLLIQHSAQQTN